MGISFKQRHRAPFRVWICVNSSVCWSDNWPKNSWYIHQNSCVAVKLLELSTSNLQCSVNIDVWLGYLTIDMFIQTSCRMGDWIHWVYARLKSCSVDATYSILLVGCLYICIIHRHLLEVIRHVIVASMLYTQVVIIWRLSVITIMSPVTSFFWHLTVAVSTESYGRRHVSSWRMSLAENIAPMHEDWILFPLPQL